MQEDRLSSGHIQYAIIIVTILLGVGYPRLSKLDLGHWSPDDSRGLIAASESPAGLSVMHILEPHPRRIRFLALGWVQGTCILTRPQGESETQPRLATLAEAQVSVSLTFSRCRLGPCPSCA